ncbi:MAG TPA: hypothetical protein VKA60_04295 [Blastocatellia bacterium]|nr:hypothetical protein [Blastocatellia bacterium]
MKTLGTTSKLMAIAALLAVATVGVRVRARAQTEVAPTVASPVAHFGLTGITRGQTARINVANVATPPDPNSPPDPCRVVMFFVDINGDVLRNGDGQPIRREVMLAAGHAAFLQINGSEFVARDETRLNFRPVVRVFVSPPDPDRTFPPPCVPTLEVIENGTGKTSLLFGGYPPPCSERQ